MTETTNLKLTMDAPSEPYSVERVNANTQKLDDFAGKTLAALVALAAWEQHSLSKGTAIPEAADMDSYTTSGVYYSPTAAISGTLLNAPTKAYGFRLEVRETIANNRILQILYPNAKGVFYMRNLLSAGWSNWFKFAGEEIVPAEEATV